MLRQIHIIILLIISIVSVDTSAITPPSTYEAPKSNAYSDALLSITFPGSGKYKVTEDDGVTFIKWADKKSSISIAEVPVSLVADYVPAMGLLGEWAQGLTPIDYKLAGYDVATFHSSDGRDKYLHVLSNGEITILAEEITKDGVACWLESNLKWKLPAVTEKSLDERMEGFCDYVNNMIGDPTAFKVIIGKNKVIIDKKHISSGNDTEERDIREVCSLLSVFSVFKELSDKRFTFVVKNYDPDGTLLSSGVIPYEEYSVRQPR